MLFTPCFVLFVGRLSDACACYDKAIAMDPDKLSYRQGLLSCRLNLGELTSTLDLVNGVCKER